MPPPCSCATSVWSYLIGTSDHTVRSEIFARWQFQRIEQAVATVGALARPPENNLAPETLLSRYSHGPPVPAVIAGHDHSTRHDWRQGHTGGLGIPASHRACRVATDARGATAHRHASLVAAGGASKQDHRPARVHLLRAPGDACGV